MNVRGEVGPVLLIDLARGFGGAEVRVIDTARAVSEEGQCTIVALADSPLYRRATRAGIAVQSVPYARHDPRIQRAIRDLVRSDDFRLVDAHNVQSQLWGLRAARVEAVPGLISTVHSEYRFENPGAKGLAHEQILKRNLAWGSRFIAVSEGIVDYLRGLLGPTAQIDLIKRSFPVASPPVGDPIRRSDLGWGEGDFIIGVVGRLVVAKGHHVLLKAMSILRDRGVAVRCFIAGDGALRDALERDAQSSDLLDRIHFAGFREDVGSVLDLADLLCVPSISEGLPHVVLEAVATRVPLVVTTVGEMPALLRDGEDAILVPPGDPVALADALERARLEPGLMGRLAESAYDTVSGSLSSDWVSQTIEVYRTAQQSRE